MDINDLPILGEGRLSIVYSLDGGKMLKVFRYPNVCQWEYRQSLAAWQAGASRQKPHEMLEVEGKDAIIYDCIEGRVLADAMKADMSKALGYSGKMAECHARLLSGTTTELKPLKDNLYHAISHAPHISDAQRVLLLNGLAAMPDGDHVLHGDLHPMNVIINGDQLEAIDWMTASRGDPAADICRSWFMMRHSVQHDDSLPLGKPARFAISILAGNAYLGHMLKAAGVKKAEVLRWLPFVAAGRLCEDRPSAEVNLILKIVSRWGKGAGENGVPA